MADKRIRRAVELAPWIWCTPWTRPMEFYTGKSIGLCAIAICRIHRSLCQLYRLFPYPRGLRPMLRSRLLWASALAAWRMQHHRVALGLALMGIVTGCYYWRMEDSLNLDPVDGNRWVTVFQPTELICKVFFLFFWCGSNQRLVILIPVQFPVYHTQNTKLFSKHTHNTRAMNTSQSTLKRHIHFLAQSSG